MIIITIMIMIMMIRRRIRRIIMMMMMMMMMIMMTMMMMMIMMMMMMTMIIIITALKGARFSQSPQSAENYFQHVRSSCQGAIVCRSLATHRALIMCNMSRVTWHEGTAQLVSLTEFESHLF